VGVDEWEVEEDATVGVDVGCQEWALGDVSSVRITHAFAYDTRI
jgi:hypothetical protein